MTEERALLLAVADAAERLAKILQKAAAEFCGDHKSEGYAESMALIQSTSGLAAYRAQPKGDEPKTVLVRAVVIMSPCGDHWTIVGGSEWEDEHTECVASEYARGKEIRAAVIVALVKPPATPVVTGSVET